MAGGYGSRCYPSETTATVLVPGTGVFRKILMRRPGWPPCKGTRTFVLAPARATMTPWSDGRPLEGRHYRRRVILPRRIKADLVDGVIATAIMFGPVLAGQGLTGVLSDSTLRLFVLGIPGGFGYSLFRDSVGAGTSLGKRALGLQLIRLEDGKPCGPGRVWARNLLDKDHLIDSVGSFPFTTNLAGHGEPLTYGVDVEYKF